MCGERLDYFGRNTDTHIWLLREGFGVKFFPLKFDVTQIKWKIHSARTDLYYLKRLKILKKNFFEVCFL